MAFARTEVKELEPMVKAGKKKFVRYQEGAELYSMGLHTFEELAKEAGAIYKIRRVVRKLPQEPYGNARPVQSLCGGKHRSRQMIRLGNQKTVKALTVQTQLMPGDFRTRKKVCRNDIIVNVAVIQHFRGIFVPHGGVGPACPFSLRVIEQGDVCHMRHAA